jgi:NDP-sugar pyrophosphorylase family protein
MKMNGNASEIRAVVLAGGKGIRLRPLTAVLPKPLVPLGEMPILEILLRRLSSFGFRNITLCTGYLSELLMAVFGDGQKFGLNIEYVRESSPLGTAGPLATIDGLTDPFIVMNGDLLTTLDFGNMLRYHVEQNAQATIGTYEREVKIDFGVIDRNNDGHFCGYREKPSFQYDVSMGVNVLSRQTLKFIEAGQHMDMPELMMKIHQSEGKVCCFGEKCYWLDIGRMDDYAKAQDEFESKKSLFLGE